MGILNVTPDSFSDAGRHFDSRIAVEAALKMAEDGAAVIDVGGESTRPAAEPIPQGVERERVIPVIRGIREQSDIPISIDTTKAGVAEAALEAGADIINDVSALRRDPEMAGVAARAEGPVILMHMRGDSRTMQQLAQYDDVVEDVSRELREAIDAAVAAGVARERILVDPGIGFAKTFDHNLELLGRCGELRALGPFVIGASRKAFIGHLTGAGAGQSRVAGSLAAVAAAYRGGAAMVRVHDVRETVDFLKVMSAIGEREP
jgi:dihydropteroate synthase